MYECLSIDCIPPYPYFTPQLDFLHKPFHFLIVPQGPLRTSFVSTFALL